MKNKFACIFVFSFFILLQPLISAASGKIHSVTSPNGKIVLEFFLTKNGQAQYSVYKNSEPVILPSKLGFQLKNQQALKQNFSILSSNLQSYSNQWVPVWGENSLIDENYNELNISLQQNNSLKRKLNLQFRVFNDGLGFRYLFPEQENLQDFVIVDELTEFKFADNHKTWWIPNNYDAYEMLYVESPLSEIGIIKHPLQATYHSHESHQKSMKGTNTPLTMQASNTYISIHEAALLDYAGMTLIPTGKNTLECDLVPWPNGDKVLAKAPFKTPWRTIQLADSPIGLIESSLIVNLNEPSVLEDTSFIEPMKYVGIWWSMHLGITTWGKEGGKHGATTEETKRYIDFASKNGIKGVLVEGWNTGWESWYKDDNFDFYTPYEDFDIKELTKYAKSKNVNIIGHHETGGQINSYEKNLDKALSLYKELGIKAVKTGYAGKLRPEGYFHHGQWMVRHYTKVMQETAKNKMMLIVHEPIKPTGLRRTYPNLMSSEGVRGMEWNAWSKGNPPEHTVMIPFTRMLAGPLDYTPGIFDLKYKRFASEYKFWNSIDGLETKGKMSTTLAKQLALYVILYSPVQMASDLIENYIGHGAFEFIRKVPVDWDKTVVLDGEIGDYIAVARKEKGRSNWFVGAATDENTRKINIDLDFLDKGKKYMVDIYKDSKDSHYINNPTEIVIDRQYLSSDDKLLLELSPGGGYAASFTAMKDSYFEK
ncbi:MAG TPA: glycoside hydrolase family 97 protein [Vampirovibrionales bacterium]